MKKIWSLCLCFLLAGCLGGRSQPSCFYTLTPVEGKVVSNMKTSIGINRVQIARYIDQPQMVTLDGQTKMTLSETNRWAEPLSDLIARTLATDLSNLLPQALVQVRTAALEPYPYIVSLDVSRMDAVLGKKAFLTVYWSVRDNAGKILAREETRLEMPVAETYEALADSNSWLVGALAEKIAIKIKSLGR